ncbi:MAG: glycosyltransferase [Pseudomonadota bacterium]
MEIRNQIVVLIRFSYATTGDFYPGFDDVAAMEAFLFDPSRLARRFALFEAVCLPSLLGQSERDFKTVFLVGAHMPTNWRQKLDILCREIPGATVIAAPPQPHYAGIKAAFETIPTEGFTHRTTVRLDDDDAVDNDFIARLKSLAPKAALIGDPTRPTAIAHNRGFFLERREDKTVVFPTIERTPLSVGAALIAPVAYRENIYLVDHRQLPQNFTTYCDTEHYAYIRTVHRDNKSNAHRTGTKMQMPNREIDAILRAQFGRKLGFFRHFAGA